MQPNLHKLRFLVIDDQGPMRTTLRRMLAELGAETIDIAVNGTDALTLMGYHRYHVVLCDYNLGDGKDGEQVLEEARQRRLVPISAAYLMVTAESTRPMVLGVLEHHPDDYLVKPFVSEVLLQRLTRSIFRKQVLAPLDAAIARGDDIEALAMCDQLTDLDHRRLLEIWRVKGELLMRTQLYDEAAAHYEMVLEERDFPWALYGLAQARRRQGRLDEARELLERLLRDFPRLIEAYDCLAEIHEAQDRPEDALRVLEQGVTLSPKSVRRQRRLGRMAAQCGDFETAVQTFRAAINQGRDSCFGGGEEFIGLSQALHQRGDLRRATAVLRDARRRFRNQPREQMGVIGAQAQLYRDIGLDGDADNFVDEAVALAEKHPDDLDVDTTLALARGCLNSAERRETGISLLTMLARNRHDDQQAMAAVDELCRETGVEGAAREQIDQVRRHLVSLNNRGVDMFRQGRIDEAADLFLQAAREMPRNRTILLNATKALLQRMRLHGSDAEQLDHARDLLQRLSHQPDPTGGYGQCMRLYRRLAGTATPAKVAQ